MILIFLAFVGGVIFGVGFTFYILSNWPIGN